MNNCHAVPLMIAGTMERVSLKCMKQEILRDRPAEASSELNL